MKENFQSCARRIAVLLFPLLIIIGCNGTSPSLPAGSQSVADFTAEKLPVRVIRGGNSEIALEAGGTVDIQKDDRISLDESGQGVLRFQDSLEVALFRKTEIHVDEAIFDPDGSVFVELSQAYGNALVRLNQEADARVTLATEYATIRTLEPGSEFIICHKPGGITCGVVYQGTVEFTAQGRQEIARAGEAIYVAPGQPPSSAICARLEQVDQWIDQLQGAGQVPGLGEVVRSWSQEPCAAVAQVTPSPQAAALPTSDGMVKIQAGQYGIGKTEPDDFHIPAREVALDAYWIDQVEVTNAQYQQFVEGTGHPPPGVWPGEADHPVQGATWDDAAAYCAWANKRLPTEAEWEAAARGPGVNPPLYPWGSEQNAGGEVDDLPQTETYAVGTRPITKSPTGAYDMAGNVWEWVGEPYEPVAEGLRILRGGRHGLIRDLAYRQPAEPNQESFVPFAGFRCAADRVEGE